MSYEVGASLDTIAKANGKLGTDDLRKLSKYSRPSPTWHLTSHAYRGLVKVLKKAGMLGGQHD